MKAVLRSKGYPVIAVDDATSGIELMKQDNEIGIVLLDMMMPGMDGYQALGLIRSSEEISNIPVIAVTAQAMTGDKEKCIQAGANDYISKPVDVDLLIEQLKKHLRS